MMFFPAVQTDHHLDGLLLPVQSIGIFNSLVFHVRITVAYDNTQYFPELLFLFEKIKTKIIFTVSKRRNMRSSKIFKEAYLLLKL